MPPRREEPILHRPLPPREDESEELNLSRGGALRIALIAGAAFMLMGGGIGYGIARTTGEPQVVEKVVEKLIERPGPERIVEKPGPERVVTVPAKAIECPTVHTVIQRIVTVEEPKPAPSALPPPKPAPTARPKPRPAVRTVNPYQWAVQPPLRRACDLFDPFC